MALTLDPNGYKWDFESALAGPTTLGNGPTLPAPTANGGYSDKGFGTCHGQNIVRLAVRSFSLTFLTLRENVAEGGDLTLTCPS